MVGPTIQDDLFSVLTKFRTFKIALTADITKIYRQVLIEPTQTSLQRIFWRNSIDESIKIFELVTVTYGTSAALFLAIRSLRKLAEENSERYLVTSRIALKDFYVDETEADTLQEALKLKTDITQLMLEGKFKLKKWLFNEPSLQNEQSAPCQREFIVSDKESERHTLGIIWNCTSDSFKFYQNFHILLIHRH